MNKCLCTFAHACETLFIEKKSKFIAAGLGVETEAEAAAFLEMRRKLHRDARHHAYAWRLGVLDPAERFSDDGEPSGTAGMPVLNILRQGNVANAVVVVTRYFGGTLLGAGGLVRAYAHSAKLLLAKENLVEKTICQKISLACDYSKNEKIRRLVQSSDVLILDTIYEVEVTFFLLLRIEAIDLFIKRVEEILCGGGKIALLEQIYHAYPFTV